MTHSVKAVHLFLSVLVLLQCAGSQTSNNSDQLSAQGREALQSGRFAEAQSAYEKLQRLEPGVPEVYVALGLIYFQEAKYDQAVPALTKALKLKANAPKAEALLAMSLSELTRYKEAVPGLERCFRTSSDLQIKRMCGLQLERTDTGLHKDSKAVEVALEMDRIFPEDPEVLYHSGRIYGNQAFLSVQHLSETAPNSIWMQQAAAEAYESHGDTDAAISAYRAVLAIDPSRAGIHFRIGRTLLSRAQQAGSSASMTETLAEFERELEVDPSNGNAAYEIAEIHRKAGELDQAANFFNMALKYYPDFGEAHLGLAAVLMAQQQPDQAVPHLKQAIALDATSEVAWYRLSRAENMLGNRVEQEKALAEFKRLRYLEASRKQTMQAPSPDEITKQQLDQNAQP